MRLGWGHDDGAFFFSRPDAAQQDCCEPGFTLLCMGLFSRFFVQALPRTAYLAYTTYSVCTSTTPETALIAPAICGDTLKRPGSFISTSVWRSSINTSDTSPLAPPAAAGSGFAGAPPRAGPPCGAASGICSRLAIDSSDRVSRTNMRKPFWVLAAAASSGSA